MVYLNVRTPILWVANLENSTISRTMKIGSVWDKYGEKVITRTIFFCALIRGSKYFSAVLPHTSTPYVKNEKTNELYNFGNDSLFRYFRALIIMQQRF